MPKTGLQLNASGQAGDSQVLLSQKASAADIIKWMRKFPSGTKFTMKLKAMIKRKVEPEPELEPLFDENADILGLAEVSRKTNPSTNPFRRTRPSLQKR